VAEKKKPRARAAFTEMQLRAQARVELDALAWMVECALEAPPQKQGRDRVEREARAAFVLLERCRSALDEGRTGAAVVAAIQAVLEITNVQHVQFNLTKLLLGQKNIEALARANRSRAEGKAAGLYPRSTENKSILDAFDDIRTRKPNQSRRAIAAMIARRSERSTDAIESFLRRAGRR